MDNFKEEIKNTCMVETVQFELLSGDTIVLDAVMPINNQLLSHRIYILNNLHPHHVLCYIEIAKDLYNALVGNTEEFKHFCMNYLHNNFIKKAIDYEPIYDKRYGVEVSDPFDGD